MLQDDFDDYDKDDENCCYIPQEVVLAYQYQREQVQRQREQLRATLRQNFERLCLQRGVHIANGNAAAHSTGHWCIKNRCSYSVARCDFKKSTRMHSKYI